jgi:hypothetical protein
LVVSLLIAAVPAVFLATWLPNRLSCRDSWPSDDIWSQDGECVGVTDGPYAFGLDRFKHVMTKIDEQNRSAYEHGCQHKLPTVTVAVLTTMTSPNGGGRPLHEMEGYAAAQSQANGEGCRFPILLKVTNVGADEQAAEALARTLKEDPSVMAVVGMGLSDQRSADAADVLGAPGGSPNGPVPMVASLITAEGFDADGSQVDRPNFNACAAEATYKDGVGHGYFFRVSHRNAKQVDVIRRYVGQAPHLIITPTDERDPYTCTALPFARGLGTDIQEVKFDPDDSRTVTQAAEQVCRLTDDVTAFYIARSRDLGRFLQNIVDQRHNGSCAGHTSITVVSTSDAVRMRVPEAEAELEVPRGAVLTSEMFRTGRLRLVYTPLADADSLSGNAEFGKLRDRFTTLGFDLAHLEGGWAVNAYDALRIVSEGVRALPGDQPSRAQVHSAINAFKAGNTRLGAGGPIEFDNSNNRTTEPLVVELCPAMGNGRPFTVPAGSGTPCR